MDIQEIKEDLFKKSMTRHNVLDLSVGLFTLLFHEFIAKPYYRTYIYANDIYDFHIADTLGNSLGTIAGIFIIVGLIGRDIIKNQLLIKITTISFILFELAQRLFGKPIDPWDVIATILTGGFCLFIYGRIHQNKIEEKGVV